MSHSSESQREEQEEEDINMSSEDDKIPEVNLNEHTSEYGSKYKK